MRASKLAKWIEYEIRPRLTICAPIQKKRASQRSVVVWAQMEFSHISQLLLLIFTGHKLRQNYFDGAPCGSVCNKTWRIFNVCKMYTRTCQFPFSPGEQNMRETRNLFHERSREKRRREMNFLNISYMSVNAGTLLSALLGPRVICGKIKILLCLRTKTRERGNHKRARPVFSSNALWTKRLSLAGTNFYNHKPQISFRRLNGIRAAKHRESSFNEAIIARAAVSNNISRQHLSLLLIASAAWLATNFHTAHALNFDCDWCGPEWEINTKNNYSQSLFDAERVSASGVTKHFSK